MQPIRSIIFILSLGLGLASCGDPQEEPTHSLKLKPVLGKPESGRWCCQLNPRNAFGPVFIDPETVNASPHRSADEQFGILYTDRLGFFDIAHARTQIDYMYAAMEHLMRRETNFRLDTDVLLEVSLKAVPEDLATKLDLAWVLAGFYSYYYEYATFDRLHPDGREESYLHYYVDGHPSAFSPEDLPSDSCSRAVASRIVQKAGFLPSRKLFDELVPTELSALLNELGAQNRAVTRKRFDFIARAGKDPWVLYYAANGWVRNVIGFTGLVGPDYLQKRNFDLVPWLVDESGKRSLGEIPPCIAEVLPRIKTVPTSYIQDIQFSKEAKRPVDLGVLGQTVESEVLSRAGEPESPTYMDRLDL